MESKSINRINSLLNNYKDNPKKIGHKKSNKIIQESFYDIIRDRKITLSELGFILYLRAKGRYNNPFTIDYETISYELNIPYDIITSLNISLQIKGMLKFNIINNNIKYSILDTVRSK